MTFQNIPYEELNNKQKEAYNFQKVSAVLANFGIMTIRLSNDWNGADFIAQLHDGKTFLKVQLKSRLTFDKKYRDKDLYICFRDGNGDHDPWYLYPHTEMLELNQNKGYIGKKYWDEHEDYSNPKPSKGQQELLEPYQLKPGYTLSL
jgi:hypothetical protein